VNVATARLIAGLIYLIALGAATAVRAANEHAPDIRFVESPNAIQPGIFDVPVIVDDPQDSRREEYRRIFWNAERSLYNFAHAQGWDQYMDKPFVKQVEIYDSKANFDKRLRELSGYDKTPIPKTFSAGIEKDIFFSVAPEIYAANYEDGRVVGAYEKLMVHELAHRLHVRLLDGNEERMGPMWFWEGFATHVADQFPNNKEPSPAEVQQVLKAKERGSYRKYNAVFDYYMKQKNVSLADFIKHAGEPDFNEWLHAK